MILPISGSKIVLNFFELCINRLMREGKLSERESILETEQLNSGSRVDLNNLIKKVKEEEKRSKRQNIAISAAALSAVAVFGIILTL